MIYDKKINMELRNRYTVQVLYDMRVNILCVNYPFKPLMSPVWMVQIDSPVCVVRQNEPDVDQSLLKQTPRECKLGQSHKKLLVLGLVRTHAL